MLHIYSEIIGPPKILSIASRRRKKDYRRMLGRTARKALTWLLIAAAIFALFRFGGDFLVKAV